jgi:hypothetical protein
MTASSTRSCRRVDLLGALMGLWLVIAAFGACAQGIDVKRPVVTIAEDHFVLQAQFDIALTPTLEDALNKGVPLYFVMDFELIRPRWYWFNDRVLYLQQEYRLSYNALTRQYRLGVGNLYQNYATLSEALEVMSRVRRRQDVEPGALRRDIAYLAAIRFRLDISQLPKPFQLTALLGREWNIGTDWYRWTVMP